MVGLVLALVEKTNYFSIGMPSGNTQILTFINIEIIENKAIFSWIFYHFKTTLLNATKL